MLHQRQGHTTALLGWVDRDQADMANCAIVRPAGDPGRLTIEPGQQPAIRLERYIELEPILAASAPIGGLLNRVGVIQIGCGERVDGNSHCFDFIRTSGLTGFGTICPVSAATRLVAAVVAMRVRVVTVALPICGTATTFGRRSSG